MEKELERLVMGAVALGYLESLMNFSPEAILEDEFLGIINGAVSKNMGLIKSGFNGQEKFCHVYAFALTLYERWSARAYFLEKGFTTEEYHDIFWASANALFIKHSNKQDIFIKIHQIAMTYYLSVPLIPNYEKEVAKLFIHTAGCINKPNIFQDLCRFLTNIDFPMRLMNKDPIVQAAVNSYSLNPQAVQSALNIVKAPGNLFGLIHKPIPMMELLEDDKPSLSASETDRVKPIVATTPKFENVPVVSETPPLEPPKKETQEPADLEEPSTCPLTPTKAQPLPTTVPKLTPNAEEITVAAPQPTAPKEEPSPAEHDDQHKNKKSHKLWIFILALCFIASLYVIKSSGKPKVKPFDQQLYSEAKFCLEANERIEVMEALAVYQSQKEVLLATKKEYNLRCANILQNTPEYNKANNDHYLNENEIKADVIDQFDKLKPRKKTFQLEPMPKHINGLPSVYSAQRKLQKLGYNIKPDGIYGSTTATVIKAFQASIGVPETGTVSSDLLLSLDEKITEKDLK